MNLVLIELILFICAGGTDRAVTDGEIPQHGIANCDVVLDDRLVSYLSDPSFHVILLFLCRWNIHGRAGRRRRILARGIVRNILRASSDELDNDEDTEVKPKNAVGI